MPFHMFGPPPPHFFALHVAPLLALGAGAYYFARHGVPQTVSDAAGRIRTKAQGFTSECRASTTRSWAGRSVDTGSSGNTAFDAYRAETLRKLEEEGAEFRAYLDGLRHAKDKVEFDQFVADRKRQSQSSSDERPAST